MVKKYITEQDPFAEREADRYEHPIPSREFILQFLNDLGKPTTSQNLVQEFGITNDELEGFENRLAAMVRHAQIIQDRRGRYCLREKLELIPGRVIGHPDGFGFVVPDKGGKDIFLSPRQMHTVIHGDRVLVRIKGLDRRGRPEGMILEVLEHVTKHIVGRFYLERGIAYVEPDNKKISRAVFIPDDEILGAKPGQMVTVEMTVPPSIRMQLIGKVTEVLGDHMAPGLEIDVAIRSHDIPHEWSEAIKQQIQQYSLTLSDEEINGRRDLRDLPLLTIDGEDAQDFDDAVYCEPLPKGGWTLYVAIADVSHYVSAQSVLDIEAHKRGNSVYFPGRVVPMLPEILSNGLCSLNPDVDRLCMVCEMSIDANGQLKRSRFYTAVMHSHARLTYTDVAKMLVDNDETLISQHATIYPHLQHLYELYQTLNKSRAKRGAIEFDTTETQIVFGPDKKIEKIVPMIRNDAHRLIEECMLMANVATAQFLAKNEIPLLYRIHASPIEEKITAFREFLAEISLQLKGGKEPIPKHYMQLLGEAVGRPDYHLIQTVLLRSLSQAQYSPDNIGHFGLAYPEYAHFTSPIRRYPDLLVHRAIKHVLSRKPVEKFRYNHVEMEELGSHCSMTERRADEATRNVVSWLKCEFLQDHIGEVYDGLITSVKNFGLFVELENIYVEGLVHITELRNDYYNYDPVKHRLRGERTGKTYRLGDRIRVLVANVDLDERNIDFVLSE